MSVAPFFAGGGVDEISRSISQQPPLLNDMSTRATLLQLLVMLATGALANSALGSPDGPNGRCKGWSEVGSEMIQCTNPCILQTCEYRTDSAVLPDGTTITWVDCKCTNIEASDCCGLIKQTTTDGETVTIEMIARGDCSEALAGCPPGDSCEIVPIAVPVGTPPGRTAKCQQEAQ